LSSLFFEIPTGVIADKYTRKLSMIIGAVISVLGVLVYVAYPSFWIFALGEIIWGLGMAFYSGADEAFLYDSLKQLKREKESKKIIGRAQNYYLFGLLVAAPIGSLIYFFSHHLQYPIFFMSIPFGLAAIVCMAMVEPKRFSEESEAAKYITILTEGTKHLINHKVLRILVWDGILVGTMLYFIIFFDQAIFMKLNIDIKYFGLLKSLVIGTEIIVITQFNRLEKIFHSKKGFLMFTGIFSGIMFLAIGYSTLVPLVILAVTCAAGFGLSRETLYTNYYNKFIPSDKRATILSSISMIRCLSIAIINPLVGLLADWSLSYTFLTLGSLILVFSLISSFRIKEKMLID